MRTKAAIINTSTSLLLQITLALSGLIIPRFFITTYGSTVNGLVSSIGQFITYMSLVEAGVGAAGTVALFKPLADDDKDKINGILAAARRFYYQSGLVFLLLLLLLILAYPIAVKNEIGDVGFIRIMIVVLSFNGIVDYFYLGKNRIILNADQKGYVISIVQIAGTIIMTAVCIIMMKNDMSALAVKTATAAIYLFRSVVIDIYVKKHYPDINFNVSPQNSAFSQRWSALLHQIVGMIVNNTDIILLTLLLTGNALVEVSVYSTYMLVGYALSSMMTSISNGISPGFGDVIARGEEKVLQKSFNEYEMLFFMLIFIAYSCMAVLFHPFIDLYCTDFEDKQLYVRWGLIALFTVCGLLQSIRWPGLTVIISAGHYKETQTRAILEAAINLIVSIVLIYPLGIYGVLLGTCASYGYRSTDVIIYSARRIVGSSLSIPVKRIIRNAVTMAIVVAVGIKFIPQTVNGWMQWIVEAILTGITVSAVFFAVNYTFEKDSFLMIIEKIRNKRAN